MPQNKPMWLKGKTGVRIRLDSIICIGVIHEQITEKPKVDYHYFNIELCSGLNVTFKERSRESITAYRNAIIYLIDDASHIAESQPQIQYAFGKYRFDRVKDTIEILEAKLLEP